MTDTKPYQDKLETQLANLITELSAIGNYDPITDNWEAIPDQEENPITADENDAADLTEDWQERRSTLADLEREYRDVKRALRKIADGTYGICEISGEPIEEARLNFRPEARTCQAHMNEEGTLPL
jgi:DnaK suppressor protein